MADIKVGVVLDLDGLKAQARKAGQVVKDSIQPGNTGGGLATGTGGLGRTLGRTPWEQASRDAMAAQLRRQRAAAAEARAASAAARAAMKEQAINAIGATAGRFGLSGAGTALRAGPIGIAIAAAVAGLLAFGHAVRRVFDALEEARSRYAKQLSSGGLPGGFITSRSVLSEVIGVSEREVLQYGDAVTFLNERLKLSSAELTRTTRTLTAVAWNWRVVGVNIRALWAQIASALAPAMNMVAKALSAWIEFIREIGFSEGIAKAANLAISLLVGALALLVVPAMAGMTAIVALGDAIQYFVRQVMNSFYRITGQADKISNEDVFAETKKGLAAIGKMLGVLGRGSATEIAPGAQASSRRLETSPWERMGLVMGSGMGLNPARETARNTRQTVQLLKKLVQQSAAPRSLGPPLLAKTAKQAP